MHEYSLVQSLLDRVQQEVDARGAVAVKRLWLRVGELAGVEAELLALAFETFRAHTVCADAELSIQAEAARWVCRACEAPVAAGGPLTCAACGSPARLAGGGDLFLDRIEMEVPDV